MCPYNPRVRLTRPSQKESHIPGLFDGARDNPSPTGSVGPDQLIYITPPLRRCPLVLYCCVAFSTLVCLLGLLNVLTGLRGPYSDGPREGADLARALRGRAPLDPIQVRASHRLFFCMISLQKVPYMKYLVVHVLRLGLVERAPISTLFR